MAPPAAKDFPRLRADVSWRQLSPAHQTILLDYCLGARVESPARPGEFDPPEVREADAISLSESLVAVDVSVRETLLQKLKEDPQRSPRLVGLTGTSSWLRPHLNGKPAAGADGALCQRRLIQVFTLLRDREVGARSFDRRRLLTNTIEWLIFAGLPLHFASTSDPELMGEYVKQEHRLVLFHDGKLKIGPDGIGDPEQTLRKVAHEVNHACRRGVEETGRAVQLVDELHAYVTELLAGGQTVSHKQVDEAFTILSGKPYELADVVNSAEGKSYRASIKYHETPFGVELLAYPLPAPGGPSAGWQHTNACPGL